MEKTRIAVIGLGLTPTVGRQQAAAQMAQANPIENAGPAGLTALKSFREEGFNVIAFERREKIGGLWSFSNNPAFTSVWDETICNISKFVTGFSDFPPPKDWPIYPTSAQAAEYFESYASHFGLHQYVRFNTTVERVIRNSSDDAWDVHVTGPDGRSVLSFDKVAFGHGCESVPTWPNMPNRDKFQGTVMHAQAYRSPAPFKGKKVLVVGIGNTACEISLSLCKHTSELYQSYRRGRMMLARSWTLDDGMPFDTRFSWSGLRLKYFLDYMAPWLMQPLADRFMTNNMITTACRSEPMEPGVSPSERRKNVERRMRDDWHILPCASMAHVHPVTQENFIPALRRGDIVPLHGFKDFAGERHVLLADDTIVEVDAVIFCTGYRLDFSIIPELQMDGACGLPLTTAAEVDEKQAVNGNSDRGNNQLGEKPHVPRLFQMIFPPAWASSIAILSWMAPQESVWCISELASMAVAQIWAAETAKYLGLQTTPGRHRLPAVLPPLDEMNAQVDDYHTWFRQAWEKDKSVRQGYVRAHSFYRFLHDAAGTGMYRNLDHAFTTRGWWLWWSDRELWTWLTKGPMTSYAWRIFETNPEGIPGCGRKAWPAARKACEEAAMQDLRRL